MRTDTDTRDLERLRRDVRRRALANLILALLDEAQRTAGRLHVQSFASDAVLLAYRDVGTLVGVEVLALEQRDFAVVLGCPPGWPFERAAAPQLWIVDPPDFRHPNRIGRWLCLDLEGVLPERLPELVYDNLRIARRRLDHDVDRAAGAFVRAHPEMFPADPRPLYPRAQEG